MNPDRVVESFLEMVAIESPSWHEAPMAAYCAEKLAAMGFRVTFDTSAADTGSDTGNLIAHLPGTAPGRVAFSAHLDTVKPCAGIEAVMEQRQICDEISCRMVEVIASSGDTILSADDKAGIAAIFEGVLSTIESGKPRPDITILLTTCEEQSLLGSSALAPDALRWPTDFPAASRGSAAEALLWGDEPLPLFVLDADGAPGSVIMGAPCHWSFQARICGHAAHAGVEPEYGISAIQIAADAIGAMPLGRIDDHTTANIGRIEGGVAVNVVPAEVTLEGECRSLSEDKVLSQRDAMTKAFEDAAEKRGGTVEIAWSQDYPAVIHHSDDAIVSHLKAAAESCGLAFQETTSGGGADANVLGAKGACAITLGIGMTNFHTPDEYIAVEDLSSMAHFVEAIITEYQR